MSDLFAPEGGFRVRILDLSGASADNVIAGKYIVVLKDKAAVHAAGLHSASSASSASAYPRMVASSWVWLPVSAAR